jgi:hypothetical protein
MLRALKPVADSQEVNEVNTAIIEAIGGVAPVDKDASLELVNTLIKTSSSHSMRLWALLTLERNAEGIVLIRELLRGLTSATQGTEGPAFVYGLHRWVSRKLERHLAHASLLRSALKKAIAKQVIKRDQSVHDRVMQLIEELK